MKKNGDGVPTVPCLFRILVVLVLIVAASCHKRHQPSPINDPGDQPQQAQPSIVDSTYTPAVPATAPATTPATQPSATGSVPALGPTLPSHVTIPATTSSGK